MVTVEMILSVKKRDIFATDRHRMFETYLSNEDGSFRKAWASEEAVRGFHGDMTNLFTRRFQR